MSKSKINLREKNFITNVIYIHNNEEEIFNFLFNLDKFLNKNFEVYDFVIVNDASQDNSRDEIKKAAKAAAL